MNRVVGLLCLVASSLVLCCAGRAQEWHSEDGFRWMALNVPTAGKIGFNLMSSDQTGIRFTNTLSELESASNRVLQNGSGVAVGDFDNDGLPDIFLCGLHGNALFKNLGQWRFKDVTEEAGARLPGDYFRGAVFADINGDGWLDLLITATGRGVLRLQNDRHGKFLETTAAAGTRSRYGSTTLALADVDGNGTLDLYVANNRTDDIRNRGRVELSRIAGNLTVPPALQDRLVVMNGAVFEYGEPDILYRNDGTGRFSPVLWTEGSFRDEDGKTLTAAPKDWGLSAAFRDVDGDGAPDIYVCNDYWTPDRIWMNDGHGRFRALDRFSLRCTSGSSMGVDFADVDRDGRLDMFVVDMLSRDHRSRLRHLAESPSSAPLAVTENRPQVMRNTLLRARGDGTFEEIANFSGVAASDWSWQPVFLDVDLDGYEDLLIPAGHVMDVQDLDTTAAIQARPHLWRAITNSVGRQNAFTRETLEHSRLYPDLRLPIVAFRNQGDLTFLDVTERWGTDQPAVHHGVAMADFDGDGDLDFVVNNLGSAAGIYRNDGTAPRVAVRLRGLSPNTQGIGGKIKLMGGAVPIQSQEIICGGRYLSGSEAMAVFAAGSSQAGVSIEVVWRNGKKSLIHGVKANRLYEVNETGASTAAPATPPAAPPKEAFFTDVSNLIGHQHHDAPFDDFQRQSLLPKKLSQFGPGVAWFDVNGDGWDDLIIGSGGGGHPTVFLNDARGGFKPWNEAPLPSLVSRDQTTVLGWRRRDGNAALLAGSANYEDGLATGASVHQYDLGRKGSDEGFPGQKSSTGPLALADFDGDGDLDLFVGGRVVPGRYPEPASSMLFRQTNGRWESDAESTKTLANAGLVSGAVWSDLDGDGFPELILACEWGPVRIFKNEKGTLREATEKLGLARQTGWWSGVTTGDLDGDGRLDIIAANWGLNSPYHASAGQPLEMHYGDFFGRGAIDLIETEIDGAGRMVPRRMLNPMAAALPFLRERFESHRAFSEATIGDVLKTLPAPAGVVSVTTLASMLFLNRGDHFEAVELPREAQRAPVFSVNVGDFDGDGCEDVFLSQNFFGVQPELSRLDAGRGLWLRGDGKGHLTALPGQESGVKVYGEQRGAALCDYDHDGRVDLVVSQNGAETKLFHNAAGKPGLRVRLRGPEGNPDGIGAALRLGFGDERWGPVREVHAGSGYWSQDSAVEVMTASEPPTRIRIRWPGGNETTSGIPAEGREISVDPRGEVKMLGDPRVVVTNRREALARRYCSSCHLFAQPELLDKETWKSGVLPMMFRRLGVSKLKPENGPGEKAVLEDWKTICEYFIENAPEKARPQGSRPPIQLDLPGFDIIDPKYRPAQPLTTMVKIDSAARQIYVGNEAALTLDTLDAIGQIRSSLAFDSAPVSLVRGASDWYVVLIGSVAPSDNPRGEVWRLQKTEQGFAKAARILHQWPRPTDVALGDLNQDGREDFVLSGFGNVLGKFSWFENTGDGYAEHVLLDRPGAIRSYIHDFNHDDKPDIMVMMAQGQEGVWLFLNEGGGKFKQMPIVEKPPVWGSAYLGLADLNRDEYLDLITANGDNGEYRSCLKNYHGIRLYSNNKDNGFTETFFYPLNGAYKAMPADFRKRGRLDIAAISFFPDYDRCPEESFVYLEEQGEGKYAAHSFPGSQRGRWLVMDVGDIDGDGAEDIVLGAYNRTPFYATLAVTELWKTNGPSLLILKNDPRPNAAR